MAPIMIQGYKQRISANTDASTPTTASQSLGNPGRGFAQAAAFAEDALNAYAKSESDAAETEAMKAVAQTRMTVETDYHSAQEKAPAGALDFTPTFMKTYDDRVNKTSDALSSDLARKKYKDKMLGFGVGLQDRAIGWEANQRQAERRQSFDVATDAHASTLFSTDAEDRESTFKLAEDELMKSLEEVGLPPDQKGQIREGIRKKLSYSAVQGDLRDRPDKVQDWLVSGSGSAYYSKVRGEIASPDYYSRLKTTESGGRNIQSESSSAFGPYQFTRGTWQAVLDKHPELGLSEKDRYNPAAQEIGIRAFTDDNSKILKARGLAATNTNLYMMHFLGEGGGLRFLDAVVNDRDGEARNYVTPAAVAANPTIFRPGRSVKDVYLTFGGKFGAQVDVPADDKGGLKPSQGPAYYADLTFEHRNQLYDQADTELRKRRSEGAAAFKQTTENAVAEYQAKGFSTQTIDENQFVAAYGVQRGTVEYGEFVASTIAAAAQHDLGVLDVREHEQYIEGMKPEEGDPFYAEKMKGQQLAKQESARVKNVIATDSAAYVASVNPKLQEQLQEISKLDSSDDATRKAAVDTYLTSLNMEFDRMGVAPHMRRVVPKAYAEALVANLDGKLRSDNEASQTATMLRRYAQAWGENWPAVYGDMQEKMSAPLKVVTSGVNPRAAGILVSVADKSFEDLAKVLPKSSKIDIDDSLKTAFGPYITSTAGIQASALPNVTTFFEQSKKLAAVYTTQGESASDAAKKAYDDVIGFRYNLVNESVMNVRIPKSVYTDGTEEALRFERAKIIEKGDIQLGVAVPGAPIDDSQRESRTRSFLMRNAQWVTMPNDSGVALFVNGRVWPDKEGRPLTRSWEQLRQVEEGAPARAESRRQSLRFGPLHPMADDNLRRTYE